MDDPPMPHEEVGSLFVRVWAGHGEAILELEGELDLATAPILDRALVRAEKGGADAIRVDLARVTFFAVDAIRVFRAAEARGVRVRLTGAGHRTAEVLALCYADDLLG